MTEMIERVARVIRHTEQNVAAFDYGSIARAAIKAMRVPTKEMLDASRLWHGQHLVTIKQWQAMIDAALEEK